MTYKPKIYSASKIDEWGFWQYVRLNYPNVEWTASWIDKCLAAQGKPAKPSPLQAERAWFIDFADIRRSDAIMLLTPTESRPLRGALVEAGYGLALGLPILIIGDHPDLSSWQYYPLCKKFLNGLWTNIEDAIDFVSNIGER